MFVKSSHVLSCISVLTWSLSTLSCCKGVTHSFYICWRNFCIKSGLVSVFDASRYLDDLWIICELCLNLTSKQLFKKTCKITTLLHPWRAAQLILARVLQLTLMTESSSAACMQYLRAWFYLHIWRPNTFSTKISPGRASVSRTKGFSWSLWPLSVGLLQTWNSWISWFFYCPPRIHCISFCIINHKLFLRFTCHLVHYKFQ